MSFNFQFNIIDKNQHNSIFRNTYLEKKVRTFACLSVSDKTVRTVGLKLLEIWNLNKFIISENAAILTEKSTSKNIRF